MKIKTYSDKEKVKSMLNVVKNRENFVKTANFKEFPTIIAENYYEIIKELISSLLLLDGFKTIGENAHKELIESLSNYKEFEEYEIKLIDDLRIRRNKSSYEGKPFEKTYLDDKKSKITKIIDKLKRVINKKLK